MGKTKIHRDYNFIENVDFDRLNEILEEKGITKAELSRKCGYYDNYVTKHVFREKRLNQTVANTLENVYGISPEQYMYNSDEPKEVPIKKADSEKNDIEDDEIYDFTFRFNGKFLKKNCIRIY